MRLDHIAYRTADRKKTAQFFIDTLGYKVQKEFDINFEDGTCERCIVLDPLEKPVVDKLHWFIRQYVGPNYPTKDIDESKFAEYHLPPEIFVSDGDPGSIVAEWVAKKDGVGGIHHIAYQVENVEKIMKEWRSKGYAEFASEEPINCSGIVQAFTKPSQLTGVIYEFIERGKHGFCQ
jgi:catechol 2,3-dioxygenase-like lactoylglutathione lyase family enzyme